MRWLDKIALGEELWMWLRGQEQQVPLCEGRKCRIMSHVAASKPVLGTELHKQSWSLEHYDRAQLSGPCLWWKLFVTHVFGAW